MLTRSIYKRRLQHITASEVPNIFDFGYISKTDYWEEKVAERRYLAQGKFEDQEWFDQYQAGRASEAMEMGNFLEDPIRKWSVGKISEYFRENGIADEIKITQANAFRVHEDKILSATLDGHVRGHGHIVQVKTHALTNPQNPRFETDEEFNEDMNMWGDDFSDVVPAYILLQVHTEMMCCGDEYRTAWVPVGMVANNMFKLRIYKINRNDKICEDIKAVTAEFWQYIVDEKQPPGEILSNNWYKYHVKRESTKTVDISEYEDIYIDLARAKENNTSIGRLYKEAQEKVKKAEALVLDKMGDATVAQIGGEDAVRIKPHGKHFRVNTLIKPPAKEEPGSEVLSEQGEPV